MFVKFRFLLQGYLLLIFLMVIIHGSCTQRTETNKSQGSRDQDSVQLLPKRNTLVYKGKEIILSSFQSGWVDNMQKTENSIIISGWAGNAERHIVPNFLLFFVDGRFILKAQPHQERPDVAEKFGNELTNSGFRVEIPLENLSLNLDSTISIIAVYPENTAAELQYASHIPFRSSIEQLKKKPNVLLISLDALRADHLSCYGYSRLTTPFLDEISSQGIRFESAFINTLGTPPSHTTILSSLYQKTHGVCLEDPGCDEFLRSNGKIHAKVIMLQEVLKQDGYITIGVTGGAFFNRRSGFARGFDEFETIDNTYLEVAVGTDRLIKRIQRHADKANPIFAFYHTYEIHSPYEPLYQYRSIFGQFENTFDLSSSNLLKYTNKAARIDDSDMSFLKAMYDSEIRFTDDTLRYMFDRLRDANFFNRDYLVVITADHGEEFGDHGSVLHQGTLYEELLHVPLIIWGASCPKGKVVRNMVSLIDIMPTILHYVRIPLDFPIQGKSLLTPMEKSSDKNECIFSQYGNHRYSIRQVEWKLIETMKPEHHIELYNLTVDKKEKNNVADEYPDIRNDMLQKLSEWKSKQLHLKERRLKKKSSDEQSKKEELEKLKTLGYIKQ